MQTHSRLLLAALLFLPLAGCVSNEPLNPSFPLTVEKARSEIDEMAAAPKPAPRPVLVLGGYMDVGIMTPKVAKTASPAIRTRCWPCNSSCAAVSMPAAII